jgi:uncharacterized protein YbdZ (MbtH family)
MPREEQDETTIYKVVVNHEEQYSIWPADRENPLGWNDAGKNGRKAECLAHIEKVWTDMRPLSLRKQMEADARSPRPEPVGGGTLSKESPQDDLVQRLAEGSHPVEVSLRPKQTVKILQECIDRGYVHVKFTDTKGGTELGVRLDQDASDLSQADFENQTGTAHLVGGLTLNYVKVRCIADIELPTLAGHGHLEVIEAERESINDPGD